MNKFDKANLNQLRNEMLAVLNKFGADKNIDFSFGNGTFNDSEFTVKLTSKIRGAKTLDDKTLESVMNAHKLKKNGTCGRVLTGYNSRASKMPFQYSQGGKNFKCTAEMAKTIFGATIG